MGQTDQFMPLKIEPWVKRTMRLSAAARGAYLELILAQWRGEELPADDDDALMRLARCTESEWAAVKAKVLPFFTRDGDLLKQERASEEKAEAQRRYEQKSSAGTSGGKASGKQKRSKTKAESEAQSKQTTSETEAGGQADTQANGNILNTRIDSSIEESPPIAPKGALDDFEVFWEEYPDKVGKKAARKAWDNAEDRPPLAEMLDALKRYKATKPADRAWAHPATWLNQGRWADRPASEAAAAADTLSAKPSEPPKDIAGWRLAAWKAIGATAYKSWIEPGIYSRKDGVIAAKYPTRFIAAWVRDHYADKMLDWMKTDWLGLERIEVTVAETPTKPPADDHDPGHDLPAAMDQRGKLKAA